MLTDKRETFCQRLAEGLTQSEAYRRSYDASGMKPSTLWEESSRLASDPEVSTRVEEIKSSIVAEIVARKSWDLDTIIGEYSINVYGARQDKQWSASNAAITGIGKALGILTDKLDVNVTHTLKPGLSLEELEARVKRLDALEAGVVEGEVIDPDKDSDS